MGQLIVGWMFALSFIGLVSVIWISLFMARAESRSQARRDTHRAAMKASWEHAKHSDDVMVKVNHISPQEWACWFALEAPEGSDR